MLLAQSVCVRTYVIELHVRMLYLSGYRIAEIKLRNERKKERTKEKPIISAYQHTYIQGST